jgi:hypothetical protein
MQITELPFVKITEGRVNPWAITEQPSGWLEANQIGRDYADLAVNYIRVSGNTSFLGSIVRSIKDYGPIEAGFFGRIAEALGDEH